MDVLRATNFFQQQFQLKRKRRNSILKYPTLCTIHEVENENHKLNIQVLEDPKAAAEQIKLRTV